MFKNTHIWLADYIRQARMRSELMRTEGLKHVVFCLVDHFEPRLGGVRIDKEIQRTARFLDEYHALVRRHRDATGVVPKYSFFYPIDEYTKECLDLLGDFCRKGYGEVEVHLHHKDDTNETLREKLLHAVDVYKGHGLLSTDKKTGETKYGFIHGNWSLCNSRADGKWCGVNEELRVLRETGCYADFSMPSAPSETQARKVNSLYYAKSTATPRSHDHGKDVAAGRSPSGDLMLIQGPLMLDWDDKKVENGALQASNPITTKRLSHWVRAGVHVRNREDVLFIKVHNHGCREDHLKTEFFLDLHFMFGFLESDYNDGKNYQLHYVTAREMYNIVKALEEGLEGNPALYRDHVLASNIKSQGHTA
jgi:hypothetical protein